jgi:hypothetical protein
VHPFDTAEHRLTGSEHNTARVENCAAKQSRLAILRLRLVVGIGQVDFAQRLGFANGRLHGDISVSSEWLDRHRGPSKNGFSACYSSNTITSAWFASVVDATASYIAAVEGGRKRDLF